MCFFLFHLGLNFKGGQWGAPGSDARREKIRHDGQACWAFVYVYVSVFLCVVSVFSHYQWMVSIHVQSISLSPSLLASSADPPTFSLTAVHLFSLFFCPAEHCLFYPASHRYSAKWPCLYRIKESLSFVDSVFASHLFLLIPFFSWSLCVKFSFWYDLHFSLSFVSLLQFCFFKDISLSCTHAHASHRVRTEDTKLYMCHHMKTGQT